MLKHAIGPTTDKRDVTQKERKYIMYQRHQRRTEPWPWAICTKNLVKISPAVPEICSQSVDRHTCTHRQNDHNTPLPYRCGVKIIKVLLTSYTTITIISILTADFHMKMDYMFLLFHLFGNGNLWHGILTDWIPFLSSPIKQSLKPAAKTLVADLRC